MAAIAVLGAASVARADTAAPAEAQITPEQIHLEGQAGAPATTLPEAPPEAPPPLPRKKGVVVEGSMGALGFLGQFRHVAPPAIWLHTQVGYEVASWLMLFGYGELAFTDTSNAADESQSRAFPIFGFGGGARLTLHVSERVALFGQGELGALKADVPRNALAILGYRNAESLGLGAGARVGVEWYQVDRHMALGLAVGVRDAGGFAKLGLKSDTALMTDASVAIRYTF
jgi:hypothetical protein